MSVPGTPGAIDGVRPVTPPPVGVIGTEYTVPTLPTQVECLESECKIEFCSPIFTRVRVFPRIEGGTRVEWTLQSTFHDPPPHAFQLQVGRTANKDADDWETVGAPANDTFYLIDDEQRVFGQTQWTHYRVCLTTDFGTYFSEPVAALGDLPPRDWLNARELLRQHKFRMQKTHAGQEGYLLKRRLYGTQCPDCVDPMTGECRKPDCTTCYNTTISGGYFAPIPCVYADFSLKAFRIELDEGQARGTVSDINVTALMLAQPQMFERDVWVDRRSDRRYYVHPVEYAAALRGVPILIKAHLRQAPYSDIIYTFPIENQIEARV